MEWRAPSGADRGGRWGRPSRHVIAWREVSVWVTGVGDQPVGRKASIGRYLVGRSSHHPGGGCASGGPPADADAAPLPPSFAPPPSLLLLHEALEVASSPASPPPLPLSAAPILSLRRSRATRVAPCKRRKRGASGAGCALALPLASPPPASSPRRRSPPPRHRLLPPLPSPAARSPPALAAPRSLSSSCRRPPTAVPCRPCHRSAQRERKEERENRKGRRKSMAVGPIIFIKSCGLPLCATLTNRSEMG